MRQLTTNGGVNMELHDDPMLGFILNDLEGYRVDEIPFREDDVVIDVGAHQGVVSIYLAKRNPDIIIHAYEPDPHNYRRLLENVAANGVENVVAHPYAVSGDGAWLDLVVDPAPNSGGASSWVSPDNGEVISVPSVTLAGILKDENIDRVRLLKMDCEGAEYGILEDAPLDRVDYFTGEFHRNQKLVATGHDPDVLLAKVEASVGSVLFCGQCGMAD